MGACLSCLGLNRPVSSDSERARLLYQDDPYNIPNQPYGSTYNNLSGSGIAPQNVLTAEEVRREQDALDNITRWANDQVVEIFPHQQPRNIKLANSTAPQIENADEQNQTHGDEGHQIMLSMIPGDRSKKSIWVYPPSSRPSSSEAGKRSVRSEASDTKINGSSLRSKDSGVLVKLNLDMS